MNVLCIEIIDVINSLGIDIYFHIYTNNVQKM